MPPPIRYDPVVTERAVIVPCPGRQIVAFSLLNGSELWRENVSGEVAGNLALDAAGKHVALVTSLGTVQRFPVEQGGRKYDAEVDGVHGGGVALEGDIAYVGGDDGKVRAIEMRTGKEIWSRKVDGPVRDAPVVHAGMIYVGTEAGSLIAYDKETGVEQWKLDAGSSVVASPLALDDRLVIGTLDGAVIGLEVASAPASGR